MITEAQLRFLEEKLPGMLEYGIGIVLSEPGEGLFAATQVSAGDFGFHPLDNDRGSAVVRREPLLALHDLVEAITGGGEQEGAG